MCVPKLELWNEIKTALTVSLTSPVLIQMDGPEIIPRDFLRHAVAWILLPPIAYLFCIPVLGPGALFVPIVVANAPLGIIGYFEKISMAHEGHQGTLILIIHAVFWSLLFFGLVGRKTMSLTWLRVIWWTLVTALFMSISGCAVQLEAGLNNPGNWH